MDRYGLLERIRRRILNDENKIDNRKSYGIEKVANKTKKFRITYHEMSPTKNTFEENVLRKVQNIRGSVAFKQCCQKLSGYDDENVDIIAKPYKSMPLLYTSKSIFRVDKNNCGKSMDFFHNKRFSSGACCSGSWAHGSSLTFAKEESQIKKAVVGVRNNKKKSHLSQSTRLRSRNKMDEIKKGKVRRPQIPAVKSSDTFDWSTKDRTVSQHVNLNIDGSGHSISCDEINVKIKQSFSTLNNLESDIDEAARFLQTSFSNRLSISSPLEYNKVDDNFSSKGYILEKDAYNNHLFPKQNIKGITRGKILGCQLRTHIAYGKNITEMSQHLRDVRNAFNNERLREYEVSDGMDSDERCFDGQSSFYATAEQRINKALHYNSLSNNERNCDPVKLCIPTISKTNSLHDDSDTDDAMNEIQNAKSEVTSRQSVIHQASNSNMKLINESPSAQSTFNDASQSDKIDSSPIYSSQELLKRKHYASNTVKALRQFYTDSMLYFVELRKHCYQRKVEDLWKVENKEEKIKSACLLLKQKYISSVRSTMSLKNLIDYHLHETARIQLLNLDLQKHLSLLRGKKKDVNFEKFRKGSEKVLLFTKHFEKNNLANELEKWELKLKTRSRGFKINGERAMNIDNTRSSLSSPLRVFRHIRKTKVQKPTNYNKNLEQLREELKWKRKEADFMKKTFDQRVMRNDQCEENSLRAQIDAHVRYITETEKDIAQLNKLENESGDNSERSKSSYERYPFLSSMNVGAASAFLEADSNETSFNADIHSINKSCNFEFNSKKKNIESQFSKPPSEEKSGIAGASGKYKNLRSPRKTYDACYFVELSSSNTLTPSERLIEQSQKTNVIEKNYSASNETQDTSKEALLVCVAHRSDINDSKLEQQKQSIVKPNDANDESKTSTEGCNLLCNSLDEQFFTPITSDIETDSEEKNGNDEMEKDRIASRESLPSFHTTISSLTPVVRMSGKTALTQSPRPRKFKLTVSPLSSPRSAASTKYAASMPHEDATRSTTSSPHTSKTSANRCISPLSASLLESLLEDSLTAMLTLEHSQASESETFVHHGEHNKTTNLTASADNSSQNDRSYDLNKIPVPDDLIPGLDLSGVNSAETEAISEKNDFPSKLYEHPCGNKEFSVSVEMRNNQVIKSAELVSSSQSGFYMSDEKWVIAEIHSVAEKIWNLVSSKQPLEILISGDSVGIASQELQMRQLLVDRCCEIAEHCFKDVSSSRYMGLTNINSFRPRNLLHLKSILQKQLSKYYESNKQNGKDKKRWELLSRGLNSDIENIILEEIYSEQDGWEAKLEHYEDEIKNELVAELWHEQLDESLLVVIDM
ncbi:Uncharacterized protein BM_BM8421 [Brugia malayi]|uniref:Bm8421 n=1 Tax=Brugia malayi TaxID=6279 RepID=A0A4E9EW88_BRUMA|nr:Uncharacterized protein BM_BM8421 [Brugia malayi]VIO88179.1 Uncharacterized protein BM_BM8421 [Brugia malayi]